MARLLILLVLLSSTTGCASCGEPEENNGIIVDDTEVVTDLSGDMGSDAGADADDAGADAADDSGPIDMYVPPPPPVLQFDRDELVLRLGAMKQPSVTILYDGEESVPDAVSWSSSDTDIATVDAEGVVTAKDLEGNTEITATTTFMEEEVSGTLPASVIAPYLSAAAGDQHTCAVSSEGSLFCWGENGDNQAATVMTGEFSRPHRYDTATEFVSVASGEAHSCALDGGGGVWCWGSNSARQVGTLAAGPVTTPVQVLAEGFGELALGEAFSCARKLIPINDPATGGELYCWGNNESGQLGTDAMTQTELPVRIDVGGVPTRWSDLAVGDRHVCAITVDGETYCWGDNRASQLGEGTMMLETEVPTLVSGAFVTLAAGGDLTCGIDAGGVFCWGTSSGGFGGATQSAAPIEVATPNGVTATEVTVGSEFACATASSDATFCWGANIRGQLGDTTTVSRGTAQYVEGEAPFRSLTAGAEHACGLNATGNLFCWGANQSGQIGDGTELDRLRPTLVLAPR